MKRFGLFLYTLVAAAGFGFAVEDPAPVLPVPTFQQLEWQKMEYVAFLHFGINTFTDMEWGEGDEDPALFNPSELDAKQWAKVLKDAGFKLAILTAKHHDGFCLWPSEYTEHSVKNSPWRDGKGDVVKEFTDACREVGLKIGLYLSPWDRNNPGYGNSPVYNEYFKNQLGELLTNYGTVDEVWFDGAIGEGPNGKKQEYDWMGYFSVIRQLQPNAVTAIMGADIRWVGNESGVARETEWSVQTVPDEDPMAARFLFNRTLTFGSYQHLSKARNDEREAGALIWYPAESDVSIRPGWFYHTKEDDKVKTLDHLMDIYFKSIGRNSVLLLNMPPDPRGLIHENDANRLYEFRREVDAIFVVDYAKNATVTASNVRGGSQRYAPGLVLDEAESTYWAVDDNVQDCWLELELEKESTFDVLKLQEPVSLGQRVAEFTVSIEKDGGWQEIAKGTTIGYKRLIRFDPVTAKKIRIQITQSRGCPMIHSVGVYKRPG